MPDQPPSNPGLCIAICTLGAPQPLVSVLRAVGGSAGAAVQMEVLLVHGRDVQPRIDAMLREVAPLVRVYRLVVDSQGFSKARG